MGANCGWRSWVASARLGHDGDDHDHDPDGQQHEFPAPQPRAGSLAVRQAAAARRVIGGGRGDVHGPSVAVAIGHRLRPRRLHGVASGDDPVVSVASFRHGEVPVVSTGVIVDPDDNEAVAAVVVDTGGRPDVGGVVAAHAVGGIGDLRCGIGVYDLGPPQGWLVRIEVMVDRPVQARVHWVVDWAGHRGWLALVASAGAVAFSTTDGDGSWLRLNVDRQRLGAVLDGLEGRMA